VAKGLKVPCLFMITEVSIRCHKTPEVDIRRIPAYTPQYTTDWQSLIQMVTPYDIKLVFLCRKLHLFLGKSTKTAATRAALFDSNTH